LSTEVLNPSEPNVRSLIPVGIIRLIVLFKITNDNALVHPISEPIINAVRLWHFFNYF